VLLDSLFKNNQSQATQYAKFMDNSTPIFSQSGRNIYASDVVQTCIDCIASECSKLQPRHIRRDQTGKIISLPGDNLNRLFKFQPNPLMSTKDFIEKTVWPLYLNYNSFIYPAYDVVTDARENQSRNYTAFWPLSPTQTEWMTDLTETLFVRFTFRNGTRLTLPYSDIIHLRKKYSINDVMGGGTSGQPDNAALLQTLQINDTILQGMSKAVQTSLGIRGIIKINTVLEDDKQREERIAFENQIADSATGILAGDFKSDFQPINFDPKVIDTSTLEFIENKILRWFGVSLPILNGTYTDDEYQAFYNKTLEPILIGMGQAYSSTLFSANEQAYNNEVVFYQQKLELMDVKNKLAIMDGLGNRGALTDNQLLSLFGFEPYEGGDIRHISLNYIDSTLANAYQLARAGIDSQTPNNQNNGGNTNGKTE
jgi:HK97 family phage portal protein